MESRKSSWVYNIIFDDPTQSGPIMADMPGEADYASAVNRRSFAGRHDASDALPILKPEQEIQLFRKMNFLKYRATRPDAQEGDREQAELIRDRLVRANLRLLFKIPSQLGPQVVAREDLVSDGEVALWRAVEKFDSDRGYRFSTFAARVIRRRIRQRVETAANRRRVVEFVGEYPADCMATQASGQAELRGLNGSDLKPYLKILSRRQRQVVSLRLGLGPNGSLTLAKVGEELGVSKTRVRQLEQQAFAKLRKLAAPAVC